MKLSERPRDASPPNILMDTPTLRSIRDHLSLTYLADPPPGQALAAAARRLGVEEDLVRSALFTCSVCGGLVALPVTTCHPCRRHLAQAAKLLSPSPTHESIHAPSSETREPATIATCNDCDAR